MGWTLNFSGRRCYKQVGPKEDECYIMTFKAASEKDNIPARWSIMSPRLLPGNQKESTHKSQKQRSKRKGRALYRVDAKAKCNTPPTEGWYAHHDLVEVAPVLKYKTSNAQQQAEMHMETEDTMFPRK